MAGDGDVPRSQTQQPAGGAGERRRHPTAASLTPFDIVLEIAARSDPVTLVRCAATCRVAAGDAFRLRFRHADRFVPSLLHGHVVERNKQMKGHRAAGKLFMVDDASPLLAAHSGHDGDFVGRKQALASRDGLVLLRTPASASNGGDEEELRVCDLVTGRSQVLPRAPVFPDVEDARYRWNPEREEPEDCSAVKYVLLVGDEEVGSVGLVLSPHDRYLQMQTFSSAHGAWGPYTKTPTPHIPGKWQSGGCRPLAVGNTVIHWLCVTGSASYLLKVKVRTSGVTVTKLPPTFPTGGGCSYLLATMSAGGRSPIVLVADDKAGRISAWTQPAKRGQLVIEYEAMLGFSDQVGWKGKGSRQVRLGVDLKWFAERSGVVLVRVDAKNCFS